MRIVLSSTMAALLLAADASASTSNQSRLPVNHAYSLGVSALRKARAKSAHVLRRKLQQEGDTTNGDGGLDLSGLGDLDGLLDMFGDGTDNGDGTGGGGLDDLLDMFGDGSDAGDGTGGDDSGMDLDLGFLEELFGGGGGDDESDGTRGGTGNIMATMICGMMGLMSGAMDEMADDMGGFTCSQFACNEEKTHLLLECTTEEEVCEGDEALADLTVPAASDVAEGEEEYCVENVKVNMKMELNFDGESEVEAMQCGTYTSPADLVELGEGCLNMTMSVDFGSIMDSAMSPDADASTSEQAIQEMASDFFTISKCSNTFADGTECDCKTCDGAIGFDLTCSKGGVETFTTEGCNDFDAGSITGSIAEFGGGESNYEGDAGEVSVPSVGVVRLTKVAALEDDSSSASFRAGSMVAGLIVAIVSFLTVH